MCKVKLKWRFGKVKLKFAENQILIWRQRFLSTFGFIDLHIPNSATRLTSKYTIPSHSSKSLENFQRMESTPLYSDTEKFACVI
ncbi:unnamed protein product [Cercopithifilaria johnstoni]|uniref:Uncharacterized protein n=1 Tax=Cercopithifilaria johnstoni TaxID=2874296 RepID=A0A8J2Q3E6_9BILA|nr:unnamed protein product [Cercopithifilaria johnstoni]